MSNREEFSDRTGEAKTTKKIIELNKIGKFKKLFTMFFIKIKNSFKK
ncbi:hypothetical protein LEP1GSC049_1306 [Leptospira kirschneri serovar Cynopteri str. 3522 CT]|uniref:Uncharacterized protein n=1 Tax=Leptospira kirschneri str. 200802841 TaxID=1193047 RepID=A0A828Y6Q1_9LEPT|nr:hypothetical protein LEP1GSC044_0995 [Leptospira kirschneri serovar Grippotyphosa str. RM52]EKO50496.1 hypothetical protein LEP1GSC131_1117 [Leptospira kirschneri str. 200802841]EKO62254.1 hypothetical protein LEP1GSC082_1279 [Leptospira kirschneri str. H2]EKP04369.1 hypothetical protein LEP1GSC018_4028 [Leptospira kirschneri str. 2008720114]EKQ84916.1 hypothetical protein LEP1GSC064_3032 [Leptospira kirschneri serovar Grippotyphosa str. Moskva]EKR08130.1 hypothetical protein LEP1GSC122_198